MPSDYGSPRKPHGRLAETRTGYLPERDCPRVCRIPLLRWAADHLC
jgi:hypothetical protein